MFPNVVMDSAHVLVITFPGLFIGLWVVCGCLHQLCSQHGTCGIKKRSHKLGPAIRQQPYSYTIRDDQVINEDPATSVVVDVLVKFALVSME